MASLDSQHFWNSMLHYANFRCLIFAPGHFLCQLQCLPIFCRDHGLPLAERANNPRWTGLHGRCLWWNFTSWLRKNVWWKCRVGRNSKLSDWADVRWNHSFCQFTQFSDDTSIERDFSLCDPVVLRLHVDLSDRYLCMDARKALLRRIYGLNLVSLGINCRSKHLEQSWIKPQHLDQLACEPSNHRNHAVHGCVFLLHVRRPSLQLIFHSPWSARCLRLSILQLYHRAIQTLLQSTSTTACRD